MCCATGVRAITGWSAPTSSTRYGRSCRSSLWKPTGRPRCCATCSPYCPAFARPTSTAPGLPGGAGQPGPPPRDIDVLVVGDPSRTDLLDVADAAQQQLHTEVSIRTITSEEWSGKDHPFLVTVASRPLITLVSPVAAGD